MSLGSTNPKRQMMINMMYLVLTALLALNVSAEILKAFALVNGGLQETNKQFTMKTDEAYDFLTDQNQTNPRAKKWYEKAMAAKKLTDTYYNYLEGIKQHLAKTAGGWSDSAHTTVERKDDLEIGTNWFIERKHGQLMKDSIDAYAVAMNTLSEPDTIRKEGKVIGVRPGVKITIKTDIPKQANNVEKVDWSYYNFHMVPVVADITEVTKFQNDIKNAESDFVNYCLSHIGKRAIKIDQLIPIVAAERAVVPSGEKYDAMIYLGAVDKSQNPVITVGGRSLDVTDGSAKFETVANGSGEQNLAVDIAVKDQDGVVKHYPAKMTYSVFTATAIISAEKMNVVYIGLDNPMAVSVPGYQPSDVIGSIDGGGTWKLDKPGHYILRPDGHQRMVKITASVKGGRKMGDMSYKVKSVPRPIIMLGATEPGTVSKGELSLASFVQANMGDFVFEGLTPTVLGGNVVVSHHNPADGAPIPHQFTGRALTAEIKQSINTAKKGDNVIVYDVKVKAIDGTVKTLTTAYIIK